MHLSISVSVFLISLANYIQISNPFISRVLLSCLGWCSKVHLFVFVTKSSSKPFLSSTITTSQNPSSKPLLSSSSCESFHVLQIITQTFFSGDQGHYSCSSEACHNHQELNSFTPFPSFTAYSSNFIPQIIIHLTNMQFMERLAFFLLS